MSYEGRISEEALLDLSRAIDYIEYGLKNTTAAQKLYKRFFDSARLLLFSPTMYPIIQDLFLGHLRVRFMPIENYLLFYTILDDIHEVRIIRFLYAKSDWRTILKTNPNAVYMELDNKNHYVNEAKDPQDYKAK